MTHWQPLPQLQTLDFLSACYLLDDTLAYLCGAASPSTTGDAPLESGARRAVLEAAEEGVRAGTWAGPDDVLAAIPEGAFHGEAADVVAIEQLRGRLAVGKRDTSGAIDSLHRCSLPATENVGIL